MNANQEIINQLAEGEDVELEGPSLISPLKYLEWCNTMKMYAPIVIVVSILIGIFLVYIFKKDKPIQKVGIFLFIIGIPVIVIVVVYGTCYLYGKLF